MLGLYGKVFAFGVFARKPQANTFSYKTSHSVNKLLIFIEFALTYFLPFSLGFPYLIAKYAVDFGLVEESCYPYKSADSNCSKTSCVRHYGNNDYHYVGGFYGACSEPLMRLELVKNGPVAVNFEVLSDFLHYKGGIYVHTGT